MFRTSGDYHSASLHLSGCACLALEKVLVCVAQRCRWHPVRLCGSSNRSVCIASVLVEDPASERNCLFKRAVRHAH